jgi:GntR family transcriptional repressor for pyruvate dehydrogenase complex
LAARETLETQLGMLAVDRAVEEDVEALEAHLAELEEAIARRDWLQASDSHVAFHAALVHALHLPALDMLLEPLQQLIVASAAPPGENEDVWDVEAHPPIIEALREKDPAKMEQALDRHYRRSRDSAAEDWLQLPFRDAARDSRENLERRRG